MDSTKVLPAILLGIFILCAGVSFFAFALSLQGIEISSLSLPVLPRFRTMIFYIVLLTFVAIISQVFTFWFARLVRKTVFRFFDSRWLPKEGKAETHTTTQGEQLERVVVPSFWATIFWDLATRVIPATFAISIIAGAMVALAASVVNFPSIIAGILATVLINLVTLSWSYWIREWRRKYTKFVVFSFMTYYVKARTPLLALLVGIGTLPQSSRTPIGQIQEVQISADPEDFDPRFKTSWIRDQYTSWLASKRNLRTIFLRSIFNRAEDILFWVDYGPGLANLLYKLVGKARQLVAEQDYISRTALTLRVGKPDDTNWTPKKGEQEATQFLARFKKVSAEPKTYDLYRVEDPGIYDNEGNPVATSGIEVQEESVNVSQHFGVEEPSTPEDFVEPPDPNLDRLP